MIITEIVTGYRGSPCPLLTLVVQITYLLSLSGPDHATKSSQENICTLRYIYVQFCSFLYDSSSLSPLHILKQAKQSSIRKILLIFIFFFVRFNVSQNKRGGNRPGKR